jgi:hypothetical protein
MRLMRDKRRKKMPAPSAETLRAVRDKLQLPEVLFPVSTPPTREEYFRLAVEACVQSLQPTLPNPLRDLSGFTPLTSLFPPATAGELQYLVKNGPGSFSLEDLAHEAAMRRRGEPARTVETLKRVTITQILL